LDEWRLIDAELDTGVELVAMEGADMELVGGTDLGRGMQG
jgi:hypothetical protein